MEITKITVYAVDLPLAKPYRLSGGRLYFECLDSTVVRIDTDDGLCGWGEGCPWGSTYLPAFARGIRAGLEELAPQLIGLDPCRVEVIERRMDRALPGHPYIKSAIDLACWDMLSAGLVSDGARNEQGTTRAPDVPGLGVNPDREVLGEPVAIYS